jgi:hypothetical protein
MSEYRIPSHLFNTAMHLSNLWEPHHQDLANAKYTELVNGLTAHNIPTSLWANMHKMTQSGKEKPFMFGQEMIHRLNAHEQEMNGVRPNPYHDPSQG